MKRVVDMFKFDVDYMLRLRIGDYTAEQHFVSYFGKLLQAKIRNRLTCPRHIEVICRDTIEQALTMIRSRPLTPPEQLSGLVNAECNQLLEKYDSSTCCQGKGNLPVDQQDEAIDTGSREDVLARNAVQEVLHQLSSRDRQTLRAAVVKNCGNGEHEICDDPDSQKEHARLVLVRAKQMFSDKLRNVRRTKSI